MITIPNNTNVDNLILATDGYKVNHWNQYPENTEGVYSYFESRPGASFPYTTFFGLQYILKRSLVGKVIDYDDLSEALALCQPYFGGTGFFNYQGWSHILQKHGGRLPLRIKAVPEGTCVPTGNVMMTVENTDPECFWLTNAVESLLTHVWYPSTVATLSRVTKEMMTDFLKQTSDNMDALPFMLHDFGFRGATTRESAAIGGAGHLVNYLGTDTIPAMLLAKRYYEADLSELAFTVPATEHSVMTALGDLGEFNVVRRLLDKYPTGILSVVADSYNIYNFVDVIGTTFKEDILARDGKFVVRPDSCTREDTTPEGLVVNLLDRMAEHFGYTNNSKGYKVLNPKVGLLWGDGLNRRAIEDILTFSTDSGYSAENLVYGMGGGLLQKINRDTQRFAFKCSAQKRDGVWHDVWKDPLDTSKASKRGRLKLCRTPDGYATGRESGIGGDFLETVFEDGELIKEYTFKEIRANAEL